VAKTSKKRREAVLKQTLIRALQKPEVKEMIISRIAQIIPELISSA
jgi:hypothetical protein